ncbi:hypothetical protein [Saccharothrix australiensis]|uniref:Uncharacterized protein n=1 Tax=Saccharothrix australiensis TaxID=2072 RepID=A0A495VZR0_9PSEU|nr:hypothetical protein [Saccharothrix australiensis]RKT53098.1 hypothetical protein C8E97_1649 [Saccharothrix australiensis]
MTTHTAGGAERRGAKGKSGDDPTDKNPQSADKPTRLSVNISPATEEALQMIVDREGITMTEAVRRMVGYGRVLYETVAVNGDEILLRRDGETSRIIII